MQMVYGKDMMLWKWQVPKVPMMEHAVDIVQQADILVVVGTSLQVYPAAGLMYEAPVHCDKFLIDPRPNLDAITDNIR
ncbi:unnamed protein product, partial [Cyprideis torosa]